MENIEYANSLYQISEILKYITPNLKARIPKKVISYFEYNKSKDFDWQIDKTVPLEKQNLLPITKEILTVLYRDYMCDDIERTKINKILAENEIDYQNELRKKYNPDNIFKNMQNDVKTEDTKFKNTISIVTRKETFFSKLFNKIKSIFSK